MDENDEIPMTAEDLQPRVEELFLRVCADPDDTETSAAADRALLMLDQLLAGRLPAVREGTST